MAAKKVTAMFDDLNILVTGGTGSFGRKLTEIMLREYSPRRLVIFSRGELKQHEMRQIFQIRDLRRCAISSET